MTTLERLIERLMLAPPPPSESPSSAHVPLPGPSPVPPRVELPAEALPTPEVQALVQRIVAEPSPPDKEDVHAQSANSQELEAALWPAFEATPTPPSNPPRHAPSVPKGLRRTIYGGGEQGRQGVSEVEMRSAPSHHGAAMQQVVRALELLLDEHTANQTAGLIRQGLLSR